MLYFYGSLIFIYILVFRLEAIKVSAAHYSIPLQRLNETVEKSIAISLLKDISELHTRRKMISFLQKRRRSSMRSHAFLPLSNQIIPRRRISTYYGLVDIGEYPKSRFRIMFDTGSSEVWVPDASCLSAECTRGHNQYHRSSSFFPRKSGTTKEQPTPIDVEYLSGNLHGYQGSETVELENNVVIYNQTVDFATSMSIPLLKDIIWDGIIGLGFRNQEQVRRETFPIWDTIIQQRTLEKKGLRNQFSYFISSSGGTITFGGADFALMDSPESGFMWASVEPSNSYWTVTVLRVEASDSNYNKLLYIDSPTNRAASIIDTGTYLIYAPKGVATTFLDDIRQTLDSSRKSCKEKKMQLPTIRLTLHGIRKETPLNITSNNVELLLHPDDYIIDYGDENCLLGIVEDDAEDEDILGGWTLGQLFLRTFYCVFDRDSLAIGFSKPKNRM